MSRLDEKLPLHDAIRSIVWSIIMISGGSALLLLAYDFYKEYQDTRLYKIEELIQSSPQKERLPSPYFESLLSLEKDHVFLSKKDLTQMQKVLDQVSFIQEATLSIRGSSALVIYYKVREPLFILEDDSRFAADSEGELFALHPFYTPKKIPHIYLGISELEEPSDSLVKQRVKRAKELIDQIEKLNPTSFIPVRLDLSLLYFDHRPVSEVAIDLIDPKEHRSMYLRLPGKRWKEALFKWQSILISNEPFFQQKSEWPMAFDLRVDQLAYFLFEEAENFKAEEESLGRLD